MVQKILRPQQGQVSQATDRVMELQSGGLPIILLRRRKSLLAGKLSGLAMEQHISVRIKRRPIGRLAGGCQFEIIGSLLQILLYDITAV